MNKSYLRIIFFLILVLSIFEGWWYIAIIAGALGAWLFSYYFEILIAGIAYDALYGLVPSMGVKGYYGIIVAAVIFMVIGFAKRYLRK